MVFSERILEGSRRIACKEMKEMERGRGNRPPVGQAFTSVLVLRIIPVETG